MLGGFAGLLPSQRSLSLTAPPYFPSALFLSLLCTLSHSQLGGARPKRNHSNRSRNHFESARDQFRLESPSQEGFKDSVQLPVCASVVAIPIKQENEKRVFRQFHCLVNFRTH